jgi:hypothetical protein
MGAAFLKWTPKNRPFELTMGFDAVLTEMHELEGEATRHAVEKGSDIVDNVIVEPEKITLEIYVTNQPITESDLFGNPVGRAGSPQPLEPKMKEYNAPYEAPFAPTPGAVFSAVGGAIRSLLGRKREYQATVLRFGRDANHVSIAQDMFFQLIHERTLVEVWTSTRVYSNMLLVSAPMTKRPD